MSKNTETQSENNTICEVCGLTINGDWKRSLTDNNEAVHPECLVQQQEEAFGYYDEGEDFCPYCDGGLGAHGDAVEIEDEDHDDCGMIICAKCAKEENIGN